MPGPRLNPYSIKARDVDVASDSSCTRAVQAAAGLADSRSVFRDATGARRRTTCVRTARYGEPECFDADRRTRRWYGSGSLDRTPSPQIATAAVSFFTLLEHT